MTPQQFKTEDATVTVYLDGPAWDGAATATLGKFSCKNSDAGAAILAQACDYIREQGISRVIGPMDGDTWHSYRFVTQTDGRPAFLLEPQNAAGAVAVFDAAGFAQISGYFSASVPLAQTAGVTPQTSADLTIEHWDGNAPETLF